MNRARGLSGRKAVLAAFALGAFSALALPPFHFIPALLIAFSGLLLLIDGAKTARSAFFTGWMWGAGHFCVGLYWISHALLIDPARFGWMIPFAIGGLSFGLGLFIALVCWAARRFAQEGWRRLLFLAAAWGCAEWLRGVMLTGFPWNLMASVWIETGPVAQFVAFAGSYALAVPTVFAFAAPALLSRPSKQAGMAVFAGIATLCAIALWGSMRIPDAPQPVHPGVSLRLVQGNIDQKEKWRSDLRRRHLEDYVALSTEPGWEKTTAVIWPETAVPFFIADDYQARKLSSLAVPDGSVLFTGAPRARVEDGEVKALWNSIFAVTSDAEIVAVYDKAHLVPFGEYVPYKSLIPFGKIAFGPLDYSAGPGVRTLRVPGLPPVSPTICYEDIFPGAVVSEQDRAEWLLNATNDGWFGLSAGPYQHFAASRLRAIEEGLPMVRAANTGISAVIDPYGRVVASLGLGERGKLDAPLPLALPERSFFSVYGHFSPLVMGALMILALVGRFGKIKGRSDHN